MEKYILSHFWNAPSLVSLFFSSFLVSPIFSFFPTVFSFMLFLVALASPKQSYSCFVMLYRRRGCTVERLLELVAVRLPSPFTQTSGRYKKLSPRSVSFIATRGGIPKLLYSPVVMPDNFFHDFLKLR